MAKSPAMRPCAQTSLDRLSRQSLYRSLAFWMATTGSVGVTMLGAGLALAALFIWAVAALRRPRAAAARAAQLAAE